MDRAWLSVLAIGVMTGSVSAACGSSPSAPSMPVPSAPPALSTITGRIVGTLTDEPIAGATVQVGDQAVVTDDDGRFRLSGPTGVQSLVVDGAGLVTRSTHVDVIEGRHVELDVIQDRSPFDLAFFRQITRNALETQSDLEPLRPLAVAPSIHIRTVDSAGQAIAMNLLDMVEAVLVETAPVWSTGLHSVTTVSRGPETREGVPGWVTVLWIAETDDPVCGRATLGTSTGRIQLHHKRPSCACGGLPIAPRTVRHELGHVYGFWHAASRGGVMSRRWTTAQCDVQPSPREIAHARYLYKRSAGNLDPDTDPGGRVLRAPREIVIDD